MSERLWLRAKRSEVFWAKISQSNHIFKRDLWSWFSSEIMIVTPVWIQTICVGDSDTDTVSRLFRHTQSVLSKQKVPFVHKIHKNWLSDTDTEPKNGLDPGSIETVSRFFPALIESDSAVVRYPLTHRIERTLNSCWGGQSMQQSHRSATSSRHCS